MRVQESDVVPVLVHNDSCPVSREDVADGLGTRGTGDPTRGQVVRDVGGGSVVKDGGEVVSGTSVQSAAIDSYLRETLPEEEYPSAGMHPAATHVETRAAWFMRNGGPDSMELVINNAGGPCEGVFSCSNVIPQILRAGQKR